MNKKTLKDAMENVTIKEDGCWEWNGHVGDDGYARWTWRGSGCRAHRAFYNRYVEIVPSGMHLDHLCRNRLCVNPSHMEIVTPAENNRRSTSPSALNMRKKSCPKGHQYAGRNLYIKPNGGGRDCISCQRERVRQWRARKKIGAGL